MNQTESCNNYNRRGNNGSFGGYIWKDHDCSVDSVLSIHIYREGLLDEGGLNGWMWAYIFSISVYFVCPSKAQPWGKMQVLHICHF